MRMPPPPPTECGRRGGGDAGGASGCGGAGGCRGASGCGGAGGCRGACGSGGEAPPPPAEEDFLTPDAIPQPVCFVSQAEQPLDPPVPYMGDVLLLQERVSAGLFLTPTDHAHVGPTCQGGQSGCLPHSAHPPVVASPPPRPPTSACCCSPLGRQSGCIPGRVSRPSCHLWCSWL